jgi:sec-independent protein translocase protein TatA
MGFGITELIIVLVIVILLFGTKKLRSLGGDLGGALKSFRGAMKDVDELEQPENKEQENSGSIIEGEVDKTAEK